MKLNEIRNHARVFGFCILAAVVMICIGSLIAALVVVNGVVNETAEPYLVYLVLMLAAVVTGVIAMRLEEKTYVAIAVSAVAVFIILLIGNMALGNNGVSNVLISTGVIISGTTLPAVVFTKMSRGVKNSKYYKMVNLYKNQR